MTDHLRQVSFLTLAPLAALGTKSACGQDTLTHLLKLFSGAERERRPVAAPDQAEPALQARADVVAHLFNSDHQASCFHC